MPVKLTGHPARDTGKTPGQSEAPPQATSPGTEAPAAEAAPLFDAGSRAEPASTDSPADIDQEQHWHETEAAAGQPHDTPGQPQDTSAGAERHTEQPAAETAHAAEQRVVADHTSGGAAADSWTSTATATGATATAVKQEADSGERPWGATAVDTGPNLKAEPGLEPWQGAQSQSHAEQPHTDQEHSSTLGSHGGFGGGVKAEPSAEQQHGWHAEQDAPAPADVKAEAAAHVGSYDQTSSQNGGYAADEVSAGEPYFQNGCNQLQQQDGGAGPAWDEQQPEQQHWDQQGSERQQWTDDGSYSYAACDGGYNAASGWQQADQPAEMHAADASQQPAWLQQQQMTQPQSQWRADDHSQPWGPSQEAQWSQQPYGQHQQQQQIHHQQHQQPASIAVSAWDSGGGGGWPQPPRPGAIHTSGGPSFDGGSYQVLGIL